MILQKFFCFMDKFHSICSISQYNFSGNTDIILSQPVLRFLRTKIIVFRAKCWHRLKHTQDYSPIAILMSFL